MSANDAHGGAALSRELLRGLGASGAVAAGARGRGLGRRLHRRRGLHRAVGGARSGRARARSVVVLEAARVGWGASGRNGGQIVNGLNAGLDKIEARYGSGDGGLRRDDGAGGRAADPRARRELRRSTATSRTATSSRPSPASRCASSRPSRRCGGGTAWTTTRCSTGQGCGGMSRATSISAACSTRPAGTCIR